MAIVMATCSNCGEEYQKTKGRKGLCPSCRAWMRNHGELRPVSHPKRNRNTPDFCANCGDITSGKRRNVKGLCVRCYEYKWRTGKDRIVKKTAKSHICRRCKKDTAYVHGRCIACYDYWRRTGEERPKDRFTDECLNCGRPLNRTIPGASLCHGKGMCRACYQYQHKYDKPRPKRLWESSHGWCDCGTKATHSVTVRVMHHDETMPLCDDCYAEHMRQVRWYGSPDITTKGNIQPKRKSAHYGGDD